MRGAAWRPDLARHESAAGTPLSGIATGVDQQGSLGAHHSLGHHPADAGLRTMSDAIDPTDKAAAERRAARSRDAERP
jgi:hypothetical protein